MRVVIQPVNPGFKDYVLRYVSEIEQPRYTLVATEGPGNTTYVFECDEENYWLAVDGLKAAVRRPPLGNAMFCQVALYGMAVWPPIVDKDKYPRPQCTLTPKNIVQAGFANARNHMLLPRNSPTNGYKD